DPLLPRDRPLLLRPRPLDRHVRRPEGRRGDRGGLGARPDRPVAARLPRLGLGRPTAASAPACGTGRRHGAAGRDPWPPFRTDVALGAERSPGGDAESPARRAAGRPDQRDATSPDRGSQHARSDGLWITLPTTCDTGWSLPGENRRGEPGCGSLLLTDHLLHSSGPVVHRPVHRPAPLHDEYGGGSPHPPQAL